LNIAFVKSKNEKSQIKSYYDLGEE